MEPLKATRQYDNGRLADFRPAAGRAFPEYLRIRGSRKHGNLPDLWIGQRGAMTPNGIYETVKKITPQAGYDPRAVWLHMYRRTFTNDWLEGVSRKEA